ncbi:MAG TPA: sugar ABC transporter permease [Symbiobacteriaceae bacterium]|nr:sugar ABC transporter permease [Symbiobacteriaceae bacterium]
MASTKVSGSRSEGLTGLKFILPATILFLAFLLYPMLMNIYQSFFKVLLTGGDVKQTWVGFKNFQQLLQDPVFWSSAKNSLLWAGWAIIIDIPLATGLAVLLWYRVPGWRFFRTAWFVPILLSYVLTALMWSWIFRLDWGLLNTALRALGLDSWVRDWLGSPKTALFCLMSITTWTTTGFNLVLILAGMSAIPGELLEAAQIDGCGLWGRVWHVLLPLTRRVIVTALILAVIGKMKVFDLVWIATDGGPLGSTETVGTYIVRRAFFWAGSFDVGYSAAMATVWFLVIAAISWLLNRFLQVKESLEF